MIGIRDANGCQNRTVIDASAQHRTHWNLGRQSSHTGGFLLVAALEAFTIGPMSADQYKQIRIRRGATTFNMSTVYMKQNVKFEKLQELKGR
jgi:hypothetical protein